MFTQAERDRRLKNAEALLRSEGLSLAILVGNGSVGPGSYGNYRYLVENRVYYHMQAVILIPGQEPIVCCGSVTHLDALNARGFQRVRMCGDRIIEVTIDVLRELGIDEGKVGICPEMMPGGWYDALVAAFPRYDFVDLTQGLLGLRFDRSQEELAVLRTCAALADKGCQALPQVLESGVTEQELAAALDHVLKRDGAEETFTLLTSGPGDRGSGGLESFHTASPFSRKILPGDLVAVEITPRYEGYWTQLIRTLCLGEPSQELKALHETCVGILRGAAAMLRPGTRAGDVAAFVFQEAEKAGYLLDSPCGRICGIDWNEAELDPDCGVLLREGMTVILHLTLTDGAGRPRFAWGETYLVAPRGGECLSALGSDLQVI